MRFIGEDTLLSAPRYAYYTILCVSLERIRSYPLLVLITIHSIRVVLETCTVTILINDLTGVIQIGILVNDSRRGLQHIDKEHAEKEPKKER